MDPNAEEETASTQCTVLWEREREREGSDGEAERGEEMECVKGKRVKRGELCVSKSERVSSGGHLYNHSDETSII